MRCKAAHYQGDNNPFLTTSKDADYRDKQADKSHKCNK